MIKQHTTCCRTGCPAFGIPQKGKQSKCLDGSCDNSALKVSWQIRWRTVLGFALIIIGILTLDGMEDRSQLLDQVNLFFRELWKTITAYING